MIITEKQTEDSTQSRQHCSDENSLRSLEQHYAFIHRHIGIDDASMQEILSFLGVKSLEELLQKAVPQDILQDDSGELSALSEQATLAYLFKLLKKNLPHRSFIGMGYYGTELPSVILRNVLENPGWYTAYTPYQAEVAQGRMEMLLNFQQLTLDLTGMEIASASLLDEATAAAEAMMMARRITKKHKTNIFYVDQSCHPQTIDVIKTRAEYMDIEVVTGPPDQVSQYDIFGVLFAYPGTFGDIHDYKNLISTLHQKKIIVAMVADMMSLVMLESPGHLGADIALGSSQRFGVPVGFGGPHAAFFATKNEYSRSMPGRIIGLSIDSRGRPAYRMALQTREQHIRRDKATSNICTSQVLLANIAACYAIWHGPQGLQKIARRIHRLTNIFAAGLAQYSIQPVNSSWFDTLTFSPENKQAILARAASYKVNLRIAENEGFLGISLDETTTREDIITLWNIFLGEDHQLTIQSVEATLPEISAAIPSSLLRTSAVLSHDVFNRYHSETAMMRYLKMLEERDLTLNRSMIALGSCTMKLNAATEMLPVTWSQITDLHPFAPREQVAGMLEMIAELESMLKTITGFAAISMQPNSGAQGEYAGLLTIRLYHQSLGEQQRNICLIPASAHGTNPASAIMCGMKVVLVDCDKEGNVDVQHLKESALKHSKNLAALMITYPSTHGVYEEGIRDICDIVHQNGGQVYMDGANMNALVEIAKPASFGVDVMHINLHKTFCIPHGGGGPGMGPIGVADHLGCFLPGHGIIAIDNKQQGPPVSAAPWGSAAILPISWSYIKMMGSKGLRKATAIAIMSANYLAKHLAAYYPVLYRGKNGWCAHEFIIDLRPIKVATGISDEDIAKRLIDYGFHAPTMSFPVKGTLMIEPTESEPKEELDRFIEAMISIRKEINQIETGEITIEKSPLSYAPHTLEDITGSWDRAYSRETGVVPASWVKENKFWPAVNRVNNVYGDRNLICACPPTTEYK